MLKQCLAVVALSALPVRYGLTLCAAPSALLYTGYRDRAPLRAAPPAYF